VRLALHAIALASLLALSHGMLRHAPTLAPTFAHPGRAALTLGAIALYGVVFFYYAALLETLPLSKLYPVYTGLSVAMVFASGVVVFKEPWSLRSLVGLVLLVAGVALVGGASSANEEPTHSSSQP
jgi:multidrug transporter EmrE-like cation transporter